MERHVQSPRRTGAAAARTRSRNASRSATSSTRSSGVLVPAPPDPRDSGNGPTDYASYLFPSGGSTSSTRHRDPSLRSIGSRVSLREQFATTRKEYEFEFDDGVSFAAQSEYDDDDDDNKGVQEEEEEEEEENMGEDDTLTTPGSFDSVVIVPPVTGRVAEEEAAADEDTRVVQRISRTHHELLCLPEGDAATKGDIRRAYFRLCDILRSSKVPAHYREAAEGYVGDVQSAFETMIGEGSRDEYAFAVIDQENETDSEDEDGEDGKTAARRRTKPRFVKKLRRQQEQGVMELGLQMDAQPLVSQNRHSFQHRQILPAGFCLTQTCTKSFPSASRFLQPTARRIHHALKAPPVPDASEQGQHLELYCTPPTVTMSSSVFATNTRSAWLPPATALSEQQNLIPDVFAKDRPLQWYATHLSPLLNLKLRQDIFHRKPGLSETALRRTLPDAVVELETDTLNAVSMTARAAHIIRTDGEKSEGVEDEPVHVEASLSVNRSWLARSYTARLGLAIHKRVSANGGTAFVCLDSGTSSSWERPAPVAFWDGQPPGGDSAGASWRTYVDNIASFLSQGLMPYYYSPPTAEVGYRFSASRDETMGMLSGRPFTKQARSGLRRLHDDVDLVDAGRGGSWTVSGAVTADGVAGYLRYGRDLFATLSPSSTLEQSLNPQPSWQQRLGFRMEAELTTQKMKNGLILGAPQWNRSQISHLAVRGLKKIGKSSKLGLELGVSNASNSVVLSLYFSRRNSQRLVLPVMLFRDNPLMNQRFSSSYTRTLFWTAFVPALALAAVDYFASYYSTSDPKSNKKARHAQAKAHRHQLVQARTVRRRAEADDLVAMLAPPILHRQRLQREDGGLVIVSAKYGVLLDPGTASAPRPSWAADEEVADVTVAVAALVDGEGRVCIPEGLRKSSLLGFWDPKPGRTKWLVVRYVYGGRETTRVVEGREELRLP